MPIKGFHHPHVNSGRRVPLSDIHLFSRVMDPHILGEIARGEGEDGRHTGTAITPTAGLGCPRRLAITRFLDYYPNPDNLVAITHGTWLHEKLATIKEGKEGWTVNGVFKGRLFGLEMEGEVDAYHEEGGVIDIIRDYKSSMKEADKWVREDRVAEPHHEAQLNMYRMLASQSGERVAPGVRMEAWVVSNTHKCTVAQVRDELAVGLTPIGVTTAHTGPVVTVREMFQEVGDLMEARDKVGEDAAMVPHIRGMELKGLRMWQSKKGTNACSSCVVKRECDAISGRL